MPTSGTHITIVQRIAASGAPYDVLLGDPDPTLDEADRNAVRMRFANLGAVGPDIFYLMLDYGRGIQDFENLLLKVGGTFECVAELMGELGRFVDGVVDEITLGVAGDLRKTAELLHGVMLDGFLAALVKVGVNVWPVFEPARQRDRPRAGWFWADYLHYIRTGRFARELIDRSAGDDNLRAYAYGYLTHYVTDVVGHPYVNQVVQGPWRLYWQRHHLVENFIDAYVWDRWHTSSPPPAEPSIEEQALDMLAAAPNVLGEGAPYTFSRLNDHINIGSVGGIDPVDEAVEKVCKKIKAGLFAIGIAEETPEPPDGVEDWATMVAEAIRAVYDEPESDAQGNPTMRPDNLGGDGYPTVEDVTTAYGAFRLLLRVSTEEGIQEPRFPDVAGDVGAALQKLLSDLAADLAAAGAVAPPSLPSSAPGFSLEQLLEALKSLAEFLASVFAGVVRTAFDFVLNEIKVAGTILSEPIRVALFLVQQGLFWLYRSLRDILLLQAYAAPFTNQLTEKIGPLDPQTLWRSAGNLPAGSYPREEVVAPAPSNEQDTVFSTYSPAVPPTTAPEQPTADFAAPYTRQVIGTRLGRFTRNTLPDDFIDAPLGPDDMFSASGPQPWVQGGGAPSTFAAGQSNFGGAIANSKRGIDLAEAGFRGGAMLPDYNLDGDRGYAWPCWDVEPRPTKDPAAPPVGTDGDALSPADPKNAATMIATVNAVPAPD
jgi:hypothetical protein